MDVNSIVQFRLLKEDFVPLAYSNEYRYEIINSSNWQSNIYKLLKVSSMMDSEIKWHGSENQTPNTEEKLSNRFQNNSNVQLWIYQDNIIGWCWQNDNLSYNWTSTNQILSSNESYTGGAFVTRSIEKPAISSLIFYNFSFLHLFSSNNKDTIYIYSDKWNRASAILCYKLGCKKYNFIKEIE